VVEGGRDTLLSVDEVVLSGGNMTPVVRVGDTVRRAAGPWTPTIHALLRHIRSAGFDAVPEPLGLDDQGREIISFLPGRVGTYPLAEFMWSDAMLERVARLLHRYHEATLGFSGDVWQWPAHEPFEVICHNDLCPYNLLFEGTELTGVIDFDLASPGPRVHDLGTTAYRFVPLTDPENPDTPVFAPAEQRRRLAAFCAAYGGQRPDDVLAAAIANLRELVAFIETSAAAGDPAQQAVLARGDVVIYERDIAYLRGGLA
jgi:Phosphotransferase enzyme family